MEATQSTPQLLQFELIDSRQLAKRLGVSLGFIQENLRERAPDRIPHLALGPRTRRFRVGSPELDGWIARRLVGVSK